MDYIERNAALRSICREDPHLAYTIERVPSPWIDVRECHPEEDQTVIGYDPIEKHYKVVCFYFDFQDDDLDSAYCWVDEDNKEWFSLDLYPFWMPLPDPPTPHHSAKG